MAEDRQLLVDNLEMNNLTLEDVSQDKDFSQLLERAKTEDLSSVEKTGCLYQAGVDKSGRPVVVFIGKWFNARELDGDKALLYLIKVLQPVVDKDYVVVYFCTRTSGDNVMSYWWIKQVYDSLLYKHKKNLKDFYIVHPSMWTRLMTWWFANFMAPAIKHKIHNVEGVKELEEVIHQSEFDVPMFIQEYDMSIHGLRYYHP